MSLGVPGKSITSWADETDLLDTFQQPELSLQELVALLDDMWNRTRVDREDIRNKPIFKYQIHHKDIQIVFLGNQHAVIAISSKESQIDGKKQQEPEKERDQSEIDSDSEIDSQSDSDSENQNHNEKEIEDEKNKEDDEDEDEKEEKDSRGADLFYVFRDEAKSPYALVDFVQTFPSLDDVRMWREVTEERWCHAYCPSENRIYNFCQNKTQTFGPHAVYVKKFEIWNQQPLVSQTPSQPHTYLVCQGPKSSYSTRRLLAQCHSLVELRRWVKSYLISHKKMEKGEKVHAFCLETDQVEEFRIQGDKFWQSSAPNEKK